MKRTLLFLSIIALVSCGSYNALNSFYEQHKNDPGVTAFRVPQFMFAALSGLSPEMNGLMNSVSDLRYIRLEQNSQARFQQLNSEVNAIFNNGFIEAYRKNDSLSRTVYAVKEKGPVIREVIGYTNDGKDCSVLYLKGNFDGEQIRKMLQREDFDSLTNSLQQQYNFNSQTPGITN